MRKIIHVGFAKTGTSYLQNTVFKELDRLGILNYRIDIAKQIKHNLFRRNICNESNQIKLDFGFDKFILRFN